MNGKSTNGTAGGGMLACIEGLPPLPKSLSGLLNSAGGSWRDMERMYVKKTMIQDDLSRGRNHHGGDGGPLASKKPPANLDAALALLRKEMVGLRQQDMSLLCQLWSLHESIQEYKGSCHDLSAASENGCYFDEDDEYYGEAGPGGPTTPGGEEPDEDATTATSSSAKNGGGGGSNGGSSSSNDSSSSSWLQDSFHVTI